jgi:glycosyltransferase involved in cell wall biosynthesis
MDSFYSGSGRAPRRDAFAIAYSGHPSKGLDSAIQVLRLLRRTEARFSLHVFGGNQLWGEPELPAPQASGVHYHGLMGQSDLARRLQECGFSLSLQARAEPFGMTLIEAMRAGCIVLASAVGAYPELIRHGHNGFLIEGSPGDEEVLTEAADVLRGLAEYPDYSRFIRRNAVVYPLDWSVIARAWAGHWEAALSGKEPGASQPGLDPCPECGGAWLPLADGLHCTGCGNYVRDPNR